MTTGQDQTKTLRMLQVSSRQSLMSASHKFDSSVRNVKHLLLRVTGVFWQTSARLV